jgi:hypothetical protein
LGARFDHRFKNLDAPWLSVDCELQGPQSSDAQTDHKNSGQRQLNKGFALMVSKKSLEKSRHKRSAPSSQERAKPQACKKGCSHGLVC